jgi:hypothetical protein
MANIIGEFLDVVGIFIFDLRQSLEIARLASTVSDPLALDHSPIRHAALHCQSSRCLVSWGQSSLAQNYRKL